MALQFIVRINRKVRARIGVLRAIIEDNKISRYENLGTLKTLDEQALRDFVKEKNLDEKEQYQLFNYASNILFNEKQCHTPIENLKREFIYFSPAYEDALVKLWALAQKHNIAFCPAEIQQHALLAKAKAVERTLNEILKKPVNILAKIGINTQRFEADEFKSKTEVYKTGQALFKLVLTIEQPLEKLCADFMKIAKEKYHKNVALKPHYFKKYATSLQRLPFWYNTVVIDLLLQHGVNPLTKVATSQVAENWVRLRKDTLTTEQAISQFKKEFKPTPEDEAAIIEAIQAEYDKKISADNV